MAKQHITYRPDERPDLEVLVNMQWCPGELRAWTQHDEAPGPATSSTDRSATPHIFSVYSDSAGHGGTRRRKGLPSLASSLRRSAPMTAESRSWAGEWASFKGSQVEILSARPIRAP